MRMSDLPVPAERVCPDNELPETDFDPSINFVEETGEGGRVAAVV